MLSMICVMQLKSPFFLGCEIDKQMTIALEILGVDRRFPRPHMWGKSAPASSVPESAGQGPCSPLTQPFDALLLLINIPHPLVLDQGYITLEVKAISRE